MKRFMTIVSALSVLAIGSSAFAQGIGWTISRSNTDPLQNSGSLGPPGTLATIYLWYQCNNTPPAGAPPATGMAAMEADLTVAPIAPLAPMNGFLNAGQANDQLLLVIGGCPGAPLVAGSLLYFTSATPLNVCLEPSAANGFNLTVDCGGTGWDNGYTGYSEVDPPCSTPLCPIISVEDATWGGIKSLYR